ncbi:hypothetical protein [Sarcina ventriculi]|uniref:hypothetical protein n=1 Tax=Sarcina ventriculi TaxID=1267 RepID=UPI00073EF7C7|nr:hypothetical protein [Sarcina ventriculi]
MKKKSRVIVLLLVFLIFFISNNALGVEIENILEREEVYENKDYEELQKINNELDDNKEEKIDILNYSKCILEIERLYDLLNGDYSNYNYEEIVDEFLQVNLNDLNDIIRYLNDIHVVNDEIKEKIIDLNDGKINTVYEITDILEKIILYYTDYKFEEDKCMELNNKESTELENTHMHDEIIYAKDSYDINEINNSLDVENSIQNVETSEELLSDNRVRKVSERDNSNIIYSADTKNVNKNEESYKVNVSNLEIIKENDKLKITFKIDSNLDLKNEKNDLKIYIGNKKMDNKILITKDKNIEKYLYLENITSISGDILKFGKDDILVDGMYTVILSDEEQKELNSVGLENLIIKAQVNSDNKVSSVVGYLKEEIALENSNLNSLNDKNETPLLIAESDSENEKSQKDIANTLPKTGIFPVNCLSLYVGIFMFLLGSFFIGYKKIDN